MVGNLGKKLCSYKALPMLVSTLDGIPAAASSGSCDVSQDLRTHQANIIAIVALEVSDFGYRIIALLFSVISCMGSRHGFGTQAWPFRERSERQCSIESVQIPFFSP